MSKKVTSISFLYEAFGENKEKTSQYLRDEAIMDVEVNNEYVNHDTFINYFDDFIKDYKKLLQI